MKGQLCQMLGRGKSKVYKMVGLYHDYLWLELSSMLTT